MARLTSITIPANTGKDYLLVIGNNAKTTPSGTNCTTSLNSEATGGSNYTATYMITKIDSTLVSTITPSAVPSTMCIFKIN